jgi:hypothetical protein
MRHLIASVLIALSGLANAASTSSVLTLDHPSVIAVFTPDADVSATDRNSEGFADFISDFNFYRSSLASELRGRKNVVFISSSATMFIFKGGERQPVTRKALSGYGFIIYVPGKRPIIFEGVATDSDVLCALKQLAPQIRLPAQCEPNQSSKRTRGKSPRAA